MSKRFFDADYREKATLADGTEVVLRLVRPEDKILFERGFATLSDEAKYYRFFMHKAALSDGELAYLTEIDQERHFALGALREIDDGSERGLGAARFVKLQDTPEVAEPAIVVVDEAQRKGLGRLLLLRLVAAARERGVVVFRSDVLADNTAMLDLLGELAGGRVRQHATAPGVITVELALPNVHQAEPPHTDRARGPHYQLMALAARGVVRVAQALHLLPSFDDLPTAEEPKG